MQDLAKNSVKKPLNIMVAVSGGVDSAVTAWLLKNEGHKVTGVFMRNWEDDDGTEECISMDDWLDAQRVCDTLGIELLQTNFSQEYKEKVFEPFIESLKQGYTPNPDVLCNAMIKFDALRDFVLNQGADYLATGHYSRLIKNPEQKKGQHEGQTLLFQAKDKNKCQSYFLYRVTDFTNLLMPLGDLHKHQVRDLAKEIGLHNHNKKDSTGICFIGERNFSKFINRYIEEKSGDMVDKLGNVVGQHSGLFHYTLGQRQGLGIGGMREASEEPWFVIGKNMADNILLVAQGESDSSLYSDELTADSICWIGSKPTLPLECSAKIRYRSKETNCTLNTLSDDNKLEKVQVKFQQAQRAITPGQSVVFYLDERCLGGGIVCD